jgi:hypothetical protein
MTSRQALRFCRSALAAVLLAALLLPAFPGNIARAEPAEQSAWEEWADADNAWIDTAYPNQVYPVRRGEHTYYLLKLGDNNIAMVGYSGSGGDLDIPGDEGITQIGIQGKGNNTPFRINPNITDSITSVNIPDGVTEISPTFFLAVTI